MFWSEKQGWGYLSTSVSESRKSGTKVISLCDDKQVIMEEHS